MRILKVRDVKTPTRGTSLSAGIDFYVPNDFKPFKLYRGEDLLIPSGIKACFNSGYMLMAAEKSGMSSSAKAKELRGMPISADSFASPTVLGAKIVDADYQGEIHIHIINLGKYPIVIKPGMKLAQFILVPVMYDVIAEVESEEELFHGVTTERGKGGFGSTGIK